VLRNWPVLTGAGVICGRVAVWSVQEAFLLFPSVNFDTQSVSQNALGGKRKMCVRKHETRIFGPHLNLRVVEQNSEQNSISILFVLFGGPSEPEQNHRTKLL
jgi:hypothetical protein